MDPDEYRNLEHLRRVGYAGAVGAAIKVAVPIILVQLLQFITRLYIALDIVTSIRAIYELEEQLDIAAIKGLDVFLFHLFATIIIPGFLTNRVATIVGTVICVRTLIPSLLAVSILPFIIQPVDDYVTQFLDRTFRKIFIKIVGRYKEDYDLNKIFTHGTSGGAAAEE